MKNILISILVTVACLFARATANNYTTAQNYRLTFCTTVLGIDYCNEHLARVKFEFIDRAIIVSRFDDVIYYMETIGRWKKNPSTGDSSITVLYNNVKWTLTARKNSFFLDDHQCSSAEFWDGSRRSQRKQHGYIRTDLEEMFEFTKQCYINREKKAKPFTKKTCRKFLQAFFLGDPGSQASAVEETASIASPATQARNDKQDLTAWTLAYALANRSLSGPQANDTLISSRRRRGSCHHGCGSCSARVRTGGDFPG